MIKVSDELLNDSAFNLEAYISKEFGRRIGSKEEEAFLLGTEPESPRGFSMLPEGQRMEPQLPRQISLSRM